MNRATLGWPTLTLLLLAQGCYTAHGLEGPRADAGSRPDAFVAVPDADSCGALPAIVSALECPSVVAPGEPVLVTLRHAASACCSDDAARLTSSRSEHRIDLLPSWDACGCCETCACVGGAASPTLDVGPLDVGTWTVVADTMTCTIEVREAACRAAPTDLVIAPTASPLGSPVPVLLSAPGVSCGCDPRASVGRGREGEVYVGIEACGCSDVDPCVDARYEATALVEGPFPSGRFTAMSAVGEVETQIVDPSVCVPGTLFVTEFEPLGIDAGALHDAPIHVFARVTYEASFCCAEPLPLARSVGVDAFELDDCVAVDCFCDGGPPRSVSSIVHLGEMAPGAHTLRIGSVTRDIVVP